MKRPAVPTGLELTVILGERYLSDHYAVLDEMRERDPVHHDEVLQRWVITRYADVDRVLRDRSMSKDSRKAPPGTYMRNRRVMRDTRLNNESRAYFLDPPEHTRLRGLVSQAFTPAPLSRWRPYIQQVTDELLDAVAGKEGFDLIEDLAARCRAP